MATESSVRGETSYNAGVGIVGQGPSTYSWGGNNGSKARMKKNYPIVKEELLYQADRGLDKVGGVLRGNIRKRSRQILGPVLGWGIGELGAGAFRIAYAEARKLFIDEGLKDGIILQVDCAMECNGNKNNNHKILESAHDEFVETSSLSRLIDIEAEGFAKVKPYVMDALGAGVYSIHTMLCANGSTYAELARDAWPRRVDADTVIKDGTRRYRKLIDFVETEHPEVVKGSGPISGKQAIALAKLGCKVGEEVIDESLNQIYTRVLPQTRRANGGRSG